MGRPIFKGLLRLVLFLVIPFKGYTTAMVHDPTAFLKFTEMSKSGMDQLKTAKEIASKASEAINIANKSVSELQNMNYVMGSPLSDRLLSRLSGLKGVSRNYGSLLRTLGSKSGDSLEGINDFSNREFGTQDRSRILMAKKHFQRKFFTENPKTIDLGKAQIIKSTRENSAKDSVLTTLAISKRHKEELSKDHQELLLISKSGAESGTLNHQSLIQTKLLERIAQSLEKLILLHSQQLDFMAKTYMGDRGVGIGETTSRTQQRGNSQ